MATAAEPARQQAPASSRRSRRRHAASPSPTRIARTCSGSTVIGNISRHALSARAKGLLQRRQPSPMAEIAKVLTIKARGCEEREQWVQCFGDLAECHL